MGDRYGAASDSVSVGVGRAHGAAQPGDVDLVAEIVDTNDDGTVDVRYQDTDHDGEMDTTTYWDPDINPYAHL